MSVLESDSKLLCTLVSTWIWFIQTQCGKICFGLYSQIKCFPTGRKKTLYTGILLEKLFQTPVWLLNVTIIIIDHIVYLNRNSLCIFLIISSVEVSSNSFFVEWLGNRTAQDFKGNFLSYTSWCMLILQIKRRHGLLYTIFSRCLLCFLVCFMDVISILFEEQ